MRRFRSLELDLIETDRGMRMPQSMSGHSPSSAKFLRASAESVFAQDGRLRLSMGSIDMTLNGEKGEAFPLYGG